MLVLCWCGVGAVGVSVCRDVGLVWVGVCVSEVGVVCCGAVGVLGVVGVCVPGGLLPGRRSVRK